MGDVDVLKMVDCLSYAGLRDNVQANLWNPFIFLMACLGFFVLFFAFMYTKRMLWFQHTDEPGTDNWLATYRAKDEATGSWGRRFVGPAAALFLLLSILNVIVMNVLELSSFQRLIFLIFYFSSISVIGSFFFVRHSRINRHVLETRPEDPFPDADQSD